MGTSPVQQHRVVAGKKERVMQRIILRTGPSVVKTNPNTTIAQDAPNCCAHRCEATMEALASGDPRISWVEQLSMVSVPAPRATQGKRRRK